jgi:3',5'-cyclic AMP phosphodiesterase CpdA
MKVLVLSDTHVVPPGETSKSLDTGERLRRAIADINAHHADAAFCVLSGDLVDHGQRDAYVYLREMLATLTVPWRLMIGNHDDRATFHQVFSDVPVDAEGFVQSVLDTAAGRMIFLDTVDTGAHDGVLCPRRLAWLSARLGEVGERPVYVFLHHPPCNIGMPVDRIKLRHPEALLRVLQSHASVRALVAGHTHHPATMVWHGYPCYVMGATHYNVGLHLTGTAGVEPRYYGPAYYAVVLLEEAQVTVHHHDFLYGYPELARPLFRRIHQDFGLVPSTS